MSKLSAINQELFTKLTPVLLVVTIGLAFAVGMLWQKVSYLEKTDNTVAGVQAQEAKDGVVPPNGKLSDAQKEKLPKVTAEDHIKGDLNAKVFLIEYSDYECPFCKQFHDTAQQAVDEYKGDVAWVYRHFPLTTIHTKAEPGALAAECIADLAGEDAFWEFTDKAFAGAPAILSDYPSLAAQTGVNINSFNDCFNSKKFIEKVKNQATGGSAAGVTGTPGNFIVTDKGEAWIMPGAVPYASLKLSIDEALTSR